MQSIESETMKKIIIGLLFLFLFFSLAVVLNYTGMITMTMPEKNETIEKPKAEDCKNITINNTVKQLCFLGTYNVTGGEVVDTNKIKK